MLRRTILLGFASATALLVAVSAGGAPDRAAADPFIGTWTVTPAAGTPWASGGKVTISASTRSEVKALGPEEGNNGWESQCVGFENPPWPPGSGENPSVSAWYVATFSWSGPKMGGCTSNKTGPTNVSLFGSPRNFVGSLRTLPEGGLTGCWSANFSSGCKYFKSAKPSEGTTKTVSEPAPGTSKFVDSPSIPATLDCVATPRPAGCDVYIDGDKGGQDPRGTIIAAEGDFERAPTAGEFIFWCWLNYDFTNSKGEVVHLSAKSQLTFCLSMALYMVKHGKLGKPKPVAMRLSAGTTANVKGAGCSSKAIPILLRKRGGKTQALGRAKKARLSTSSLRYSCRASGGTATIGISAPRGLRPSLGKKLDLKVGRATNVPRRSGKLRITFGWK